MIATTRRPFSEALGAGKLSLQRHDFTPIYTAAGVAYPHAHDDALAALDDELDVVGAVAAALDAAAAPVLPPGWVEDAVDAVTRAHAVERLRADLQRGSWQYQHFTDERAAAHAVAVAAAPELNERFHAAAARLPAGDDPLDADACIDAGRTAALADVRESLDRMGALAALYSPGHTAHGLDWLAAWVDVPDVPVEKCNDSGATLNPDTNRDVVRLFSRIAAEAGGAGADLALVTIARTPRSVVHVEYAADATQVGERVRRVRRAHAVEVVSRHLRG